VVVLVARVAKAIAAVNVFVPSPCAVPSAADGTRRWLSPVRPRPCHPGGLGVDGSVWAHGEDEKKEEAREQQRQRIPQEAGNSSIVIVAIMPMAQAWSCASKPYTQRALRRLYRGPPSLRPHLHLIIVNVTSFRRDHRHGRAVVLIVVAVILIVASWLIG